MPEPDIQRTWVPTALRPFLSLQIVSTILESVRLLRHAVETNDTTSFGQ
jgi:hypothetical protein